MPFKVYIAGTEVYQANFLRHGTIEIGERVNGRDVLSAEVVDRQPSPIYRPAILSTVVATDDESSGTGSMSLVGDVVTLSSGSFSVADEGKTIEIFGAGVGSQPLWAEIVTVGSATIATISREADIAVSGVTVRWGVRRFGGTLQSVTESAIGGDVGISTRIECVDFNELPSRREDVKETYPAGQTLRQVVIQLVATYLAVYGVFVDLAMPSGPTLEEQVFDYVSATDAFNHLSDVTGWVWDIDYIRQFTMRVPVPGTTPVELKTGVNANVLIGSQWTSDVNDYRNVQIVRIGNGTQDKVDNFVGNGSNRVFPLTYTPVAGTRPAQVEMPSGSGTYLNVGVHGVDTLFEWTYRSSDNALVQLTEAPPGTPHAPVANGVQFRTVPYVAAFPMAVSFTNGLEFALRGPYVKRTDAQDIFDKAAGEELAEGLVRRYDSIPKRVSLGTSLSREPLAAGFHAGQQGPITITERQISGQHLIEAVRSKDSGAVLPSGDIDWFFEIDAIEGDEYQGSWEDWFRQIGGTSGGGSASGGVATGGGGGGGGGTGTAALFRVLLGVRTEDDPIFAPAAGVWFDAPGAVDWVLRGNQIAGLVRMRIHLKSASTNATVSARYFNTSASAPVSDPTTGVNTTTLTHREVFCTLVPDLDQVYRLQLMVSGAAATTAPISYSKPTLENAL